MAKRIYDAVSRLQNEPFRFVVKVVNSPWYRMRVGDYRVIVDIQQGRLMVLVLRVGHRRKIYGKRPQV